MPESASPMQPGATIIEIRLFRGGWQCFEAPGVGPYWTGESAKDDAIGYAQARAKFGRGEIRILAVAGTVGRVIVASCVVKESLLAGGHVLVTGCVALERKSTGGRVTFAVCETE